MVQFPRYMKLTVATIAVLGGLFISSLPAQTATQEGVAGKWATDSVATFTPDRIRPRQNNLWQRLSETQSRESQSGTPTLNSAFPPIVLQLLTVGPPPVPDQKPGPLTLTGTAHELSNDNRYKVENGVVNDDRSFSFTTIRKVGAVQIPTQWKGEVTDRNTLTITRLNPAGNPIDTVEGIPLKLIFHRAK